MLGLSLGWTHKCSFGTTWTSIFNNLLVKLLILIVPLIASENQDFLLKQTNTIIVLVCALKRKFCVFFVLLTYCRLAHAKEETKFQYFSMLIKEVFLMRHATIIKPKIKVRTIITSSTVSSVDRDQVWWLSHCLHVAHCDISHGLDGNPRYRQMNKNLILSWPHDLWWLHNRLLTILMVF